MFHHTGYWRAVAVMCLMLLVSAVFLGGNLFALPCDFRCRNNRCAKVPDAIFPTKPCVKYALDFCGILLPAWRTDKASQGTCTAVPDKMLDVFRCKDCTAECTTPSFAAGCATECEKVGSIAQFICKTGTNK